ncbi:expressed unknown protein [Seminavis robusta]|uniref:Uncharacterized protein n=1 Tax=Seminavis robusta TaxID=568900 RepID=A0A9N8E9Q5_9STRA|nr:expressed unknown protein [Seminavis robusta]|eukprot:Sro780_g201440.1 n/a (205) ;mRNA; f:12224-12838
MNSERRIAAERAGSFDGGPSYKTIVELKPIDDIQNMGETRHIAIGFVTCDSIIRDYRGSATFDQIPGTPSFRFFIRGVRTERNDDGTMKDDDDSMNGGVIETMELRLTSRFEWYTKSQKIKGNETSGRIIRVKFLRSEEEQHANSIAQIDVIVPKSKNEDKGKLLELAMQYAASLVDANIAHLKLKEEEAKQLARSSSASGESV